MRRKPNPQMKVEDVSERIRRLGERMERQDSKRLPIELSQLEIDMIQEGITIMMVNARKQTIDAEAVEMPEVRLLAKQYHEAVYKNLRILNARLGQHYKVLTARFNPKKD